MLFQQSEISFICIRGLNTDAIPASEISLICIRGLNTDAVSAKYDFTNLY